jgi:dihydroxyacid dehydratase/phosphogluconate dehydratase
VSEDELAARSERLGQPELPAARGYLSIYQRSVQSMSKGAVLVERG